MVAALWFLVASEPDKGPRKRKAEVENLGRGLPLEAGRTIVGLGGTLAGAQLLVIGARGIAETAGLSEGFVGLTIVAVGTSLPELFAAIQSGRRGQTDLILGNVLGSNIFNSLGIAGLAMLIDPGQVASNVAQTGAIAMSVIAIAAFVMMARGRIGRIEGAMLLIAFVVLVPLLQ
jgi:cation:H+ antiporter